jgi:DNA-binding XRE family transcriptional regulator
MVFQKNMYCNRWLLNFKGKLVDFYTFSVVRFNQKRRLYNESGKKIYELRTEKTLSQGDLADRLDVSRQSVSKWGKNTAVPDLDKLIKIRDIFEISLDELTGREKLEEKPVSKIEEIKQI